MADRWPTVCVKVNHATIWTGPIQNNQTLIAENLNCKTDVSIQIEYYGKQEQDTVVNNGNIVANQHVCIAMIEIDDVCFKGSELANLSSADYNLTESQKAAYNINNFPWTHVKTDTLWNNGTWQINLRAPILTTLLKSKIYPKQVFELDHRDVLTRLQNIFEGDHHVV